VGKSSGSTKTKSRSQVAQSPPANPPPREDLRPKPQRVQAGTYSDGLPFDRVHYVQCKMILKPDRFTSAHSLLEYGDLMRKTAKAFGIELLSEGIALKPEIREVLFLDTPDFRLYKNSFILRRRISYDQGFPTGDPEMVFKFRHPNLQTAAELDVRPNIAGIYRIKFKLEVLPLKDQVGGYRLLHSHNVELGLSQLPEGDQTSMATVARIFPCLSRLRKYPSERVGLVNQTIVEEVLQDLGTVYFGKGMTAKATMSLWRERGMHRPLCAEAAFQTKFKQPPKQHDDIMRRGRDFFIALQQASREWLYLGTTKTGLVYRLASNPPRTHE
jgi:hypothetical protein